MQLYKCGKKCKKALYKTKGVKYNEAIKQNRPGKISLSKKRESTDLAGPNPDTGQNKIPGHRATRKENLL